MTWLIIVDSNDTDAEVAPNGATEMCTLSKTCRRQVW